MSLYKKYERDSDAIENGRWFDYDGVGFKLTYINKSNGKYQRAFRDRTRKYTRAIEKGTISDAKIREIDLEIFLDAVLIDWKNVTDREGQEIVFNRENAKQLLADLPDLYTDLVEEAKLGSNFNRGDIEADVKN